jgi:hypothetical protein
MPAKPSSAPAARTRTPKAKPAKPSSAPAARSPKANESSLGVISADDLYTLSELKLRLGLGRWALRQARRAGLRFFVIGRKKYIRGSEVIRFLEKTQPA